MNASPACLRTATLFTALAAILLGGAAAAQAAPAAPSLDERIHCQEALERVYWSHRSQGQGPAFAQAVPQSVIRQRAEDAVLETAALEHFWSVTITPAQLQAELDRMAADSQSPARLRELFARSTTIPREGGRVPGPPAARRPSRAQPLRPRSTPARRRASPRRARGGRDRPTGRAGVDDRSAQRSGVAARARPTAEPRRARARAGRVRRPRPRSESGAGRGERRDRARPTEPAARRREPLFRHRRPRAGRPPRRPLDDRVAQAAVRGVVERDARAT